MRSPTNQPNPPQPLTSLAQREGDKDLTLFGRTYVDADIASIAAWDQLKEQGRDIIAGFFSVQGGVERNFINFNDHSYIMQQVR